MLASWEPLFLAARYEAAELHEATDWLALNDPPRFPGEHLRAIQGRIRHRRTIQYVRDGEKHRQEQGICVRCSGAGQVTVPHIASIRDGEWMPLQVTSNGKAGSYYTMAVGCSCWLGRRWVDMATERLNKNERTGSRAILLEEYAAANPRWELQLAQRREEQAAEAELLRDKRDLPAGVKTISQSVHEFWRKYRERMGPALKIAEEGER